MASLDRDRDTVQMTNPIQPPRPQPVPVYLVPQQPPKSWMATVALTFGVIGVFTFLCTFGMPSALAVIFGHAARADTRRNAKSGNHQATTGLVLGYVVLIPLILITILSAAGIEP